MTTREFRRILLDGNAVDVRVDGADLVAGDGRRVAIADAIHLPPVTPSKIVCVHLNYISRVKTLMIALPPAPTYFHKPVSALNTHNPPPVRPAPAGDLSVCGSRPPLRRLAVCYDGPGVRG